MKLHRSKIPDEISDEYNLPSLTTPD
jgi:hypothetical protein